MMTVRWLGQSGYAIAAGGTRLLLDPYLSDAVERVAGRPRLVPAPLRPQQVRADAVICTHDHLDHLDVDAAAAMPAGTRFLTTAGGAETLRRLGQTQVQTLAVGRGTRCISVGIRCWMSVCLRWRRSIRRSAFCASMGSWAIWMHSRRPPWPCASAHR